MKAAKLASLFLAGAVGLTACSDDAANPITAADSSAPVLNLSAGGNGTGNHLVVFKNQGIPSDFAARVAALGGKVAVSLNEVGAATVSGLTPDAAGKLQNSSGVSIVEPEILLQLPEPAGQTEAIDAGIADHTAGNPADAHRYAWQWNMRAIDADDAWAAGYLGSSDVTVAILDTGIGYTHADLQGLVDLERSVSFLPLEDAAVQQRFPGAHPIADLGYHGTHVAATVASNAVAAAGVTSKTTLMGVKVCGTVKSGCPGGAIFAGIRHAVQNGADVINMSLGGAFQKSDYPGYVATINRLFTYANRNNVTVVVSAGNSAADLDHDGSGYKTYCSTPTNFCVSATGPTASASRAGPFENVDAPAYYTNYGRSAINVAAPGGNRGGSVWAACSTFSIVIPVCQTAPTYVVGLAGTSMAAPHTSGLAALMVEKYGKNASAVKDAIMASANDLGASGTDPYYGKGRINVFSAVTR